MSDLTPLEQAVATVLAGIPTGVVMTYGEVAEEAGFPGRARAVGHFLARSGGDHPWWRVVAANGRLVPGHEAEHARRLRAEGVEVGDRGVVAMRSSRVRRSGPPARPASHRPASRRSPR